MFFIFNDLDVMLSTEDQQVYDTRGYHYLDQELLLSLRVYFCHKY